MEGSSPTLPSTHPLQLPARIRPDTFFFLTNRDVQTDLRAGEGDTAAQESGNKLFWVLAVTTSPKSLEPLTGSQSKVSQLGRELPAGPSHTEESPSCLLLSLSDGQVVSSYIFNQALLGIVGIQSAFSTGSHRRHFP